MEKTVQYEDLITQVNQVENVNQAPLAVKSNTIPLSDEDHWRSIIQTEVTNAVTILKENSQSVITSLEKHNQKLEEIVEKLQVELNQSSNRQQELEKQLKSTQKELSEVGIHKSEDDLKIVQKENKRLQKDLDNMSRLYNELRNNYESNVKKIEQDIEQSSVLTNECEAVKQEYNRMKHSICELTTGVATLRDSVLSKTDSLREKLRNTNSAVFDECYLNNVTSSLQSIEIRTEKANEKPNSKSITDQYQAINSCRNAMNDIEQLNIINSDLEIKLKEIELDQDITQIEEENGKLKDELLNHSKLIENLEDDVQGLKEELVSKSVVDQRMQETLQENVVLTETAKESLQKINSYTAELKQTESIIKKQNAQLAELSETAERIQNKSEELVKEVETLKIELQTEKNTNDSLTDENNELRARLNELVKENNKMEVDIDNLQDTLESTTKDNQILNEKLSEALKMAEELQEENENNQEKIETYEKINKDLKLYIDSLTHRLDCTVSETEIENYKTQITELCKRNCELKAQHDKDKTSNDVLLQRMESLKFYHENEARAHDERFKELQLENDKLKEALKKDLDILRSDNESLIQRLDSIEDENHSLRTSNTQLNSQLEVLNESLSNRNIAIDKCCSPIQFRDDNLETSMVIADKNVNSSKFMQKSKRMLETDSSSENINTTKQRELNNDCCEIEDKTDIILKRLSSIEKQVHAILNTNKDRTDDVKSISMPNLDAIDDEDHRNKTCQANIEMLFATDKPEIKTVRKSSSLEFINSDDKSDQNAMCVQSSKSKWDGHIDIITKLRKELMDIIEKLNLSQTLKSTSCKSPSYSDHYKQVVESLQRQVTELTVKSAEERNKCYGLEAELQGLKGEMVQKNEMEKEISKLRKEMSTQKYKKIQEIESAKKQKEAEMMRAQQKLQEEYLDNKQKLLSDLGAVQKALQEKTEEEFVLRKKCSVIVKEATKATCSRPSKPATSGLASNIKFVEPVPIITPQVKQPCAICKIKPSTSAQTANKCCHKEKPKVPLRNARDKLNTTIEKHRISSDPAPVQSVQVEELKKKYNIK